MASAETPNPPTDDEVAQALATLMRAGWNPLPPAQQQALIRQRDELRARLED